MKKVLFSAFFLISLSCMANSPRIEIYRHGIDYTDFGKKYWVQPSVTLKSISDINDYIKRPVLTMRILFVDKGSGAIKEMRMFYDWDRLATCTHSHPIAFVCHDNLLRETAHDELKEYKNFAVYESLEDFESYLKLTKQHLEEKFIRTIARKATKKFWTLADDTTLYYREKIRETLHSKYQANFENPMLSDNTDALVDSIFDSDDRRWNQIDGGMFWVYSAQFVESPSDKEYIWKTRIAFTRQYLRQPSPTGGISEFFPDQRLLKLSFEVLWQARITDAARFMKMDLLDIALKEKSFKAATAEDIAEYGLDIK